MSNSALAWRLAWRELRGGVRGFRVFIACLVLGVAAIAAVGTISESILAGIHADSRKLLGGDFDLRLTHREANPEQKDWLDANAERVSELAQMRAMVRRADGETRSLVELKAIDPPLSVKDSMEKQMRAERDRRAAILTAEGVKQSQILEAEGQKQSAILKAEGEAQSAILTAEGEARAILQVFDAIHEGDADSKLLAYQYLQMLPEIAKNESNKVWFVPTEFTGALKSISAAFGMEESLEPLERDSDRGADRKSRITSALTDPAEALRQAKQEVEDATSDATDAGTRSGRPFDPNKEKGQQ